MRRGPGTAASALLVLDEGKDVGKRERLTTLAAGQQVTASDFRLRGLLGWWRRAGDDRGLQSVCERTECEKKER